MTDRYDEKAREILLGKVRKTSQELADDIASELRNAGEREATLEKKLAEFEAERNQFQTQAGARKRECFELNKKLETAKEALRSMCDEYEHHCIDHDRYTDGSCVVCKALSTDKGEG